MALVLRSFDLLTHVWCRWSPRWRARVGHLADRWWRLRWRARRRLVLLRAGGAESGQTTAEYALVLIGAVAVALLLIAWVTGSGKIGELFDAVFDDIISKVS